MIKHDTFLGITLMLNRSRRQRTAVITAQAVACYILPQVERAMLSEDKFGP